MAAEIGRLWWDRDQVAHAGRDLLAAPRAEVEFDRFEGLDEASFCIRMIGRIGKRFWTGALGSLRGLAGRHQPSTAHTNSPTAARLAAATKK